MTIASEQLAEWRRLAEAATSGPWTADLDVFDSEEGIEAVVCDEPISMLVKLGTDLRTDGDDASRNKAWAMARDGQELRDAAFIAAARTAVPALLDEVERLRWELADLGGIDRDQCIHGVWLDERCVDCGQESKP